MLIIEPKYSMKRRKILKEKMRNTKIYNYDKKYSLRNICFYFDFIIKYIKNLKKYRQGSIFFNYLCVSTSADERKVILKVYNNI